MLLLVLVLLLLLLLPTLTRTYPLLSRAAFSSTTVLSATSSTTSSSTLASEAGGGGNDDGNDDGAGAGWESTTSRTALRWTSVEFVRSRFGRRASTGRAASAASATCRCERAQLSVHRLLVLTQYEHGRYSSSVAGWQQR